MKHADGRFRGAGADGVRCMHVEGGSAPRDTEWSRRQRTYVLAERTVRTSPCEGPLEPGAVSLRPTPIRRSASRSLRPGGRGPTAGEPVRTHRRWDPAARPRVCTCADGIYFLHDPVIAARDCEDGPRTRRRSGRSSDLVAWLETAPGLSVSEPTPVTVGGFDGMQLDIEIAPEWKQDCFFSDGTSPPCRSSSTGRLPSAGTTGRSSPSSRCGGSSSMPRTGSSSSTSRMIRREPSADELFQTGGEIVETFAFSSS